MKHSGQIIDEKEGKNLEGSVEVTELQRSLQRPEHWFTEEKTKSDDSSVYTRVKRTTQNPGPSRKPSVSAWSGENGRDDRGRFVLHSSTGGRRGRSVGKDTKTGLDFKGRGTLGADPGRTDPSLRVDVFQPCHTHICTIIFRRNSRLIKSKSMFEKGLRKLYSVTDTRRIQFESRLPP